ncbi:MAG: hypothetical protein GX452_11205 [Ignavibacteriales bacterium]|nr:hypothetical protein [Ignavibacteriales bacterium]
MLEDHNNQSDFSADLYDEMNSRYSFFDGIFLLIITLAVLAVLPLYKIIKYMSGAVQRVFASII